MSTGQAPHARHRNPSNAVAGNGLLDRRALLRTRLCAGRRDGAPALRATGAAAEPLKNDPWSLEMGEP